MVMASPCWFPVPDKEAGFDFVIKRLGGGEVRRRAAGRQNLAGRAFHRRAAHDNRGRPAVIADGHIFVVGKQRILRPEEPAYIRGVMDRGVEVGVVADPCRLEHGGFRHGEQMGRHRPLMIGRMRMAGPEEVAEQGTQRRPALRPACHEWVQRSGGTGLSGLRGKRRQQARVAAAPEVQYLVANGYADGGLPCTLEDPKGQVLDGECATRTIGRGYPALPLRIMCSIHGCIYEWGSR